MRTCAAIVLIALGTSAGTASARPILRRADVAVVWTAPDACEVAARFEIDADAPRTIDHRLLRYEGSRVERVAVDGPVAAGTPHEIGRTESLDVRIDRAGTVAYRLAYRVLLPAAWVYRCPIWTPTAATDGVSHNIVVHVQLPAEAAAGGGILPRFTWTSAETAEVTLANVPAFVRTPFARPGEHLPWSAAFDVNRAADITGTTLIGAASLVWLWRRRR